jgi:hypothetical protein
MQERRTRASPLKSNTQSRLRLWQAAILCPGSAAVQAAIARAGVSFTPFAVATARPMSSRETPSLRALSK